MPNTVKREVEGELKDVEIEWQVSIYRYMSGIYTEDIDFIAHSGLERQYTDNYLR